MEALVQKKLVRSIGLSNFNKTQIDQIIGRAQIMPAVNQIESHPFLNQENFIKHCHDRDIQVIAHSPLGSNYNHEVQVKLISNHVIKYLAEKYNKSWAQICLRWQLQRGVIVLPRPSNVPQLEENIQLFKFVIAPNDMELLNFLDKGDRGRTIFSKE